FAARRPHAFDADAVALAAALGQLAGPALDRAAGEWEANPLHTGALRAEARAGALATVGRALAPSLDPDEVLTLLVERAATATGADAVGVLEADVASGSLRLRRTYGLSPGYGEGLSLPVGAGIAGAVLADGRPLWTADILADPRFSIPEALRSLLAAEQIRGILAVPIRGREAFSGVLAFYWRAHRTFGDEEIAFGAQIADQAAIAIENARLYKAKADVARQQAALLEIGAALNAAITQEGTFQLIIDKAVETLGADKGTLFVYDPAAQELSIVAARGLSVQGMGFRLRMGESAAGRAILWRRPVVVPDVEADTEHDIAMDHVHREGIRALLILPLVTGDEVVGAISLARRQPTRFSEEDIALLTLFAHQAAVALRNARLFEELARSHAQVARHKEQLQELYRLGVAMQSAIPLRERLDLILQGVHGVLGLDRIGIFLCDRGKEVLECRAAFGNLDELVERIKLPLGPDGGMLARAFHAGQEVVWTDGGEIPGDLRLGRPYSDIQALRSRSFACLPLVSRGRTIGLLVADNKVSRRAFSDETLSLLRTFASQAAIAIENARLFDHQHEEAAAAELQRAQAEALAAVGQAISASLDLDEVLSLLVERTAAATGASAAAVLERETPTEALRFRKAFGLSHRYLDGLTFSSPAGVSGAALASGRAHCTPDVLADPGFAYPTETRVRMAAEGIRGLLSVPIRGGDGPYGVLNLYWQDPHPCTEEEIAFAARIANQAALAIENARLFRQEQERRRQVETIRAITEEITRELDLATLLNLIHRRAMELVGATSGCIHLWDEAAQVLIPKAWHGLGDWMEQVRFRLGEGISGVVALRREGLVINDYRAWPQASPLFLAHTGVTATLA
ncbi:MAG TPA: GAF domain-containing protein, partial [Candidatus Methylomirabilis sp.]